MHLKPNTLHVVEMLCKGREGGGAVEIQEGRGGGSGDPGGEGGGQWRSGGGGGSGDPGGFFLYPVLLRLTISLYSDLTKSQ